MVLVQTNSSSKTTGRTARPNSPAWIGAPQKLNRDCRSFVGNLAVDSQFGKILFTTEARRAQRKMKMNLASAAMGMASVRPKEMAVQRQGTGSPRRSVARAARFLRRHLRGEAPVGHLLRAAHARLSPTAINPPVRYGEHQHVRRPQGNAGVQEFDSGKSDGRLQHRVKEILGPTQVSIG